MIGYIFKSLYKNGIIVEQRKIRHWWLALIFGLLSLVVTLVPTMISSFSTRGSSILTSSKNYELDRGLLMFSDDQYDIVIGEDAKIATVDDRLLAAYTSATPIVYGDPNYVNSDGEKTPAVFLQVYFYDGSPLKDKDSQKIYTEWINTNVMKLDEDKVPSVAPHSYMMICRDFFSLTLYSPTNTDKKASYTNNYSGLYDHVKGENLKDLKGADNSATLDEWKIFLNDAYETTKNRTAMFNILIYGGLNLIIFAIGTLVVFLGLRSRRSIYTGVNFGEAAKIAATMAFTPALISMLLGFLPFGMISSMSFILAYGMRLMWLISKSNSTPTSEQKPVYQARS